MRDTRGHTPPVYSEAAHECLIDLCLFPGFLRDAYSCLDCRVECSNLFEDIVRVMARRAHVRSASRGMLPVSQLALKGLVAAMGALVDTDSTPECMMVPPKCLFTCQPRSDLWHGIVLGQGPECEVRRSGHRVLLWTRPPVFCCPVQMTPLPSLLWPPPSHDCQPSCALARNADLRAVVQCSCVDARSIGPDCSGVTGQRLPSGVPKSGAFPMHANKQQTCSPESSSLAGVLQGLFRGSSDRDGRHLCSPQRTFCRVRSVL
jgi:hypothetical protein